VRVPVPTLAPADTARISFVVEVDPPVVSGAVVDQR
jgi:hypothetical protein